MGDPALSEGIVKHHLDVLCQAYHKAKVSDHHYTHGNCTLTVVSDCQIRKSEEDEFGGDMNHLSRVCVVMECEGRRRPFSLIVKIAPEDVLVHLITYNIATIIVTQASYNFSLVIPFPYLGSSLLACECGSEAFP